MKYQCILRSPQRSRTAPMLIEATDAYEAALVAARRHGNHAFDAVEVWDGRVRVLTWIRPADEPTNHSTLS